MEDYDEEVLRQRGQQQGFDPNYNWDGYNYTQGGWNPVYGYNNIDLLGSSAGNDFADLTAVGTTFPDVNFGYIPDINNANLGFANTNASTVSNFSGATLADNDVSLSYAEPNFVDIPIANIIGSNITVNDFAFDVNSDLEVLKPTSGNARPDSDRLSEKSSGNLSVDQQQSTSASSSDEAGCCGGLKIVTWSMSKVIEKAKKKEIEKPRTGGDKCVRCRLHNRVCIGYPVCVRCRHSRRYKEICYQSKSVVSANGKIVDMDFEKYSNVVGKKITWLPYKQKIKYVYSHVASITLPIRKIQIGDKRYLSMDMYDSATSQFVKVDTPSYVTTLDFGELQNMCKSLLVDQLLPMAFNDLQTLNKQTVISQTIIAAYELMVCSDRDKEERELVGKALQLWAFAVFQEYSTMEFESWSDDGDAPPSKVDFDNWCNGCYMAPKIVDMQFSVAMQRYCAKVERELVEKLRFFLKSNAKKRKEKWYACYLSLFVLFSSWEQDNYNFRWQELHGRYNDAFEWPIKEKPGADDLVGRNEYLFKQLRVEFWNSCWRKPFKLDWEKEDTHAHVGYGKDAVEFMRTVGKSILNNKSKMTAARTNVPTYGVEDDLEDAMEQVAGSLTSWLVFD